MNFVIVQQHLANTRSFGIVGTLACVVPTNTIHFLRSQFKVKNVNVSFYDAEGKRVNEYSNVKEIMSMASVYTYAHDYLDVETFKKYCEELYDKSSQKAAA
jgi:hypothetical protein